MLADVDVPSPVLRTGFHTHTQTFQPAHAGAVVHKTWRGLELEGGVGDVGEDGVDFGFGEDDGEAFVLLGAEGIDAGEFDVENLAVVEEDDVHDHVLGACGDVFGDGEVGEEGGDVGWAEVARVAEGAIWGFVEVGEAGDPVDEGLFGAVGVVFGADDISDTFDKLSASLVEQFGFGHRMPSLSVLEGSLPMRRLPYSTADYASNLRGSKFEVSNLRLNK